MIKTVDIEVVPDMNVEALRGIVQVEKLNVKMCKTYIESLQEKIKLLEEKLASTHYYRAWVELHGPQEGAQEVVIHFVEAFDLESRAGAGSAKDSSWLSRYVRDLEEDVILDELKGQPEGYYEVIAYGTVEVDRNEFEGDTDSHFEYQSMTFHSVPDEDWHLS